MVTAAGVYATAVQTIVRARGCDFPVQNRPITDRAMVPCLPIVAVVNRLVLGAEATFEADDARLLRRRQHR